MEQQLREMISEIESTANIGIPYYAYGDNEAACEMASALNQIAEMANQCSQYLEYILSLQDDKPTHPVEVSKGASKVDEDITGMHWKERFKYWYFNDATEQEKRGYVDVNCITDWIEYILPKLQSSPKDDKLQKSIDWCDEKIKFHEASSYDVKLSFEEMKSYLTSLK